MFQFITHRTERYDEIAGAQAALEGGCRWIQLRMKGASDAEFLQVGRPLIRLCRRYGATCILDDRAELVVPLEADGVHLGRNDMPVAEARRLLGPGRRIGATANVFADIERAAMQGADYIGLGPFRFTQTKSGLSPILGLEGCRSILERCREAGIAIPVVAIGGITADDIGPLLATGVSGIALSGALLGADDPVAETRKIVTILNSYKR